MNDFLDRIPFADKVKLLTGALGVIAICASFIYRAEQTAAVARGNQSMLNAMRMELVEVRTSAAMNQANTAQVAQSLEHTTAILTRLLDRMTAHDIEDSRREAEIKANAREIERLRGPGSK